MFFVWIMWETGSDRLVLFFSFSFFHICLFWFNFILRIRFCFLFCVWIIMWETERIREKKKSEGERKNWYNNSWDNFLSKKIDLKVLQCSLDLENYCSNFKKKNWRSCAFGETVGAWIVTFGGPKMALQWLLEML